MLRNQRDSTRTPALEVFLSPNIKRGGVLDLFPAGFRFESDVENPGSHEGYQSVQEASTVWRINKKRNPVHFVCRPIRLDFPEKRESKVFEGAREKSLG